MSLTIERPFTSRTYVALAIARGVAAANGHANVTGCHIVLGLLREGENPAVAVLQCAGVPLRTLRQDLEEALPPRGDPSFGEVLLPATTGERGVVDAALVEAASCDTEYVGNQHLLLAVLHDSESVAAQILARHGVTYETASEHLRAVLAGPR